MPSNVAEPESLPSMRFSVVIPTYNRATILPRAIHSVLDQTYTDVEVVVVDDGSTDGTREVVAAIDDARVTYLAQPNRGVSAARNTGAGAATGEFIVFLDSDDVLLPDAVQRYSTMTADNDVVVGAVIKVSADLLRWRTVTPDRAGVQATAFTPLLAGGFAIRRSRFRACGGYDDDLRYSENTDLAWRLRAGLLAEHRIDVVEEPVALVFNQPERGHDQSRYDAARRILDRRSYALETEPSNARALRKFRANYLAIAGVSAARLGRRGEALSLVAHALLIDPLAPARYRALLSVARGTISSRPSRARRTVAQGPRRRAPETREAASVVHAVIVTYERPERLRRTITKLPTEDLASVTIVDNSPSPASREAAACAAMLLPSEYVDLPTNTGPAGALAEGVTRVLAKCSDRDWILVLNDDGVPGSEGGVRRLREFGEWLVGHGAPVGAVGIAGGRFDRASGRLVRPADRELFGPVTVDYVAGNQLMMIRAGAARAAGTFDPDLFFGFEELDCCLRLQRAGFAIFADGPSLLRERDKYGRLGDEVGPAPRTTNPWRRYYSVRNRIVIMRRYSTPRHAIAVTFAELFGRPFADIRKRRAPRGAFLVSGTRGCLDAWLGRLGRRVEPVDD